MKLYLLYGFILVIALSLVSYYNFTHIDTIDPLESPIFALGDCLIEMHNEWNPEIYQIVRVGNYSYRAALVKNAVDCQNYIENDQYCKTIDFKEEKYYKNSSCNN